MMSVRNFIFSRSTSHRVLKHFLFWVLYAFYFTAQSYGCGITGFINEAAGRHALYSSFCYLPFCILSVYSFIYLLFPYCLQRKRYGWFAFGLLAVFAFGIGINYFESDLFFKLAEVGGITAQKRLALGYDNVTNAIIISGFALGLKIAQNWYKQREENLGLEKQKTLVELQLLKARIQPDFLFQSLDNVYAKIDSKSPDAPQLILKLADLMSYILYECNHPTVSLSKELLILQDYINLERSNFGNRVMIAFHAHGDTTNKRIVPLVLLPILQNGFVIAHRSQQNIQGIYINIAIDNNEFLFTLAVRYRTLKNCNQEYLESIIHPLRKKLEALYPGKYLLSLEEQGLSSAIRLSMPPDYSLLPGKPIPPMLKRDRHEYV
jgi:hypothetical protein